MTYTIIVNKKSYDLPKRTVNTVAKLKEALEIDRTELDLLQKYERLYDFVKEMLGDEAAADVLGADTFEDVDVSDIEIVVLKIKAAYEKPVNDYKTGDLKKVLNDLPLDKLISISQMQGLNDND